MKHTYGFGKYRIKVYETGNGPSYVALFVGARWTNEGLRGGTLLQETTCRTRHLAMRRAMHWARLVVYDPED